jgi:hypothetical protein
VQDGSSRVEIGESCGNPDGPLALAEQGSIPNPAKRVISMRKPIQKVEKIGFGLKSRDYFLEAGGGRYL